MSTRVEASTATEAHTAADADSEGFMDACSTPREIADIQTILGTYKVMSRGRHTLSTPEHESCAAMFYECRRCIGLYSQERQNIGKQLEQLATNIEDNVSCVLKDMRKQIKSGGNILYLMLKFYL